MQPDLQAAATLTYFQLQQPSPMALTRTAADMRQRAFSLSIPQHTQENGKLSELKKYELKKQQYSP